MDLLKSVDVKGFVVGTSNVLFKNQKHCLWDALNNVSCDNSHLKIAARSSFCNIY